MRYMIALAVLFSLKGTAQQDKTKAKRDSLLEAALKKMEGFRPETSPVFKAVKSSPGNYDNQGNYHSSHIYLYPDSAFAYYSVF